MTNSITIKEAAKNIANLTEKMGHKVYSCEGHGTVITMEMAKKSAFKVAATLGKKFCTMIEESFITTGTNKGAKTYGEFMKGSVKTKTGKWKVTLFFGEGSNVGLTVR